mmetsp:Transcript_71571/g.111996  ORF Transcript_71571/g.111996 Transcript_71571/m.111996 type:complete len:181 (-) Transcript_71571:72-614(-)
MEASISYVHKLIRKEMERGISADRIFLGGFSQGGCVAVRAALSFPDASLGGCLALSTFLGDGSNVVISKANSRLNVLSCHGQADNIVPPSQGESLTRRLREEDVVVHFKSYPDLGHSYNNEEVRDVRLFLLRRLAADGGFHSLQELSARELKKRLNELDIDVAGCLDKSDLLERAKSFLF